MASSRALTLGRLFAPGVAASVIGFSIIANALMLTGPLYMLQIYDRVLASGSLSTLWALTVLAAVALLSMTILEAIRTLLLSRAALNLEASIGPDVFSAAFTAQAGTNRSAQRHLRDLETVRGFLMGQGPVAILDAPWVPLYLLIIYLFHPLLGIVATIGAAVLFILAIANEFVSRSPTGRAAEAFEGAGAVARATLGCTQAVTAMGMLPALRRRWQGSQGEGLRAAQRAGARSGNIQASSRGIRHGLQVAMLGFGAALAVEGVISAGVMIVASIIMGRALAPVEQAIGHWRGVLAARAAWSRLSALLKNHSAEDDARVLPPAKGAVEVSGLVCIPPGASGAVLKAVSFRLEPGEILAVIGPSGAGKSSLARILAGVWRPAMGTVKLDGAPLADFDANALGSRIGYLPQETELLDGTIAENISRFAEAPGQEEILRAARMAGTDEFIYALPQGFETLLTNPGQPLSGGQRQRVGLARALYGGPCVVILDEPGASLDHEGELSLAGAITALKAEGCTVIVIAHRPSILTLADKVLVLKNGMVQAFDTAQKILPKVVPVPRQGPAPGKTALTQAHP